MKLFTLVFLIGAFSYPAAAHIKKDSLEAMRLISAAEVYVRNLKKDSALIKFSSAAKLFHRVGLWEHEARVYNRISMIQWRTHDYASSIKAARDAEDICLRKLSAVHPELIEAYNNYGAAYYFSGQFNPSLEYYHKALVLQRQLFGDVHPGVANSCNYIGILNWELGNGAEALEYHQQSLIIRRKIFGERHIHLAYSYTNIGLIYRAQGKLEEALNCYKKSLDIARLESGEKSVDYALNLHNMASVFGDQGNYDLALEHNLRACAITRDLLGEFNSEITLGYDNIGHFYEQLGHTEKAFEYYNKALAIRQQVLGPKHSSVARSFQRLGDLYFKLGNYNEALNRYQNSLIAAIASFNAASFSKNPDVVSCERQAFLLNALQKKGETLMKIGETSGKQDDYHLALATFIVADSLIDEVRKGRSNHEDKLIIGKTAVRLYEGAIKTCVLLFEKKRDSYYKDRAFYFSERSRTGILAEALLAAAAKFSDNVPYQIIELERKIRTDQSRVRSNLRMNMGARDSLEAVMFRLNRTYDSLMSRMKINFPSHYEARFQRAEVNVSEIRNGLSDNAIMVEYFEGKDNLYAFALTKHTLELNIIKRDSVFDQTIKQFHKAIVLNDIAELNAKNFSVFTESANKLYDVLLASLLKSHDDIEKLIIIPHGQLSFLPFDALISAMPKAGVTDYASLDYLIKNFSIQYGYSARLLMEAPAKRSAGRGQLAFAPAYTGQVSDSLHLAKLGKFRHAYSNLKWNQQEADLVSKRMGGKSHKGNNATEARFKTDAPGSRILHLAMHAFVDDEEPMNSKLVFYPEPGSGEDGYLHAFELYNMELNAELVVLSACSTGFGSLAEGEGVLSLARAFTFSGVASVTMTHWNVDDKASSDLMALFYASLNKGKSKSSALRDAKLAYLDQADPVHAHPFFWAAYASIGADTPVSSVRTPTVVLGTLIFVALMTLVLVSIAKRRKR